MAAALSAKKLHLRVAHVEAGLRSGDLAMPEERNRIEVDRVSSLLLAPDERSRDTLAREGVPGRTEVVGDVMRDALDLFLPHAPAVDGEFVLCTIHREANVQPDRLARIAAALNALDARVVFPAHPRTASRLPPLAAHVEVVKPLGYLELLGHARSARAVVTDSGGLQKEAYWLRVPCVTLRPSTEWVDTVGAGANTLAEPEQLAEALEGARFPEDAPPLYGDGQAAGRVAAALYA
jgi:UDP-N-acetylglucosamine 2-epimerase